MVAVTAEARARIHVCLVDMNGELGRKNISVGFGLKEPRWELYIETRPTNITVSGINDSKIELEIIRIVKKFVDYFRKPNTGYYIKVKEAIPQHIGLGSTTSLCIALGDGLGRLHGKILTVEQVIRITNRAGTSGIGFHSVKNSGLLIDAGSFYDNNGFLPSGYTISDPPKLIGAWKMPFKEILFMQPVFIGPDGEHERDLFDSYTPISGVETERITRLIISRLLPSLVESDVESFCNVIDEIQNLGFKKKEVSTYDENIRQLMCEIRKCGGKGVGMSSFGPGIYVMDGDFERLTQHFSKHKLVFNVSTMRIN